MEKTPEELRPDLIEAALPHVAFDGWSDKAMAAAARDIGVSPEIARLAFPGGPADMVEAYLRSRDEKLLAELKQRGLDNMRIRDKIAAAVRVRLEFAAPHKEAVARTLRFLSQPQYAGLASRSLWRTADVMWRAAGDTATDFNHYSKRAILSGVYSATLLYWLSDHSEDHRETWAFLDRRIDNVMQFEKTKAHWRKSMENMPSLSRFLGRLRYPAA